MFCPVALIPQVIQKMTTYRYIMITPGWPGISWFWYLVDLSNVPRLPLWVNLLTHSFSNRIHNNLGYLNSYCLASGVSHKIQEDSQRKWQRVLRNLREARKIDESKGSIFGKWCVVF